MTPSQKPQDGGAAVRYEPHCDCLGGHVSMVPDPNGRWCRADAPRAVADDPRGIVQQVQAYIAPKLFGGRDAKTPVEGVGVPAPTNAFRLKNSRLERLGEDLLIESEVEYPCSQES